MDLRWQSRSALGLGGGRRACRLVSGVAMIVELEWCLQKRSLWIWIRYLLKSLTRSPYALPRPAGSRYNFAFQKAHPYTPST